MPTLPNVTVTQTNGNLGRTAPSADGVTLLVNSGIAVGAISLGVKSGPYYTLAQVEAAGVDSAYDNTNSCLVWQMCKDFFDYAPDNTEMYLLILADTVSMTTSLDKTTANGVFRAVRELGDKVSLVAVGRVTTGTPTYTNQFEDDLATAVPKAQELRDYLFAAPYHCPVQIILEGRAFQGTAGSAKDNHTFTANRVSVFMGQDAVVAAKKTAYAKYAAIGIPAGVLSRDPVQRSLARVKSGALTNVATPALSSGTTIAATDPATLEALNAKGYIFLRTIPGLNGVYMNDDHTCAPLTDDYCKISSGRVMDKASRIARTVYLNELNDEVQLDPATGKLPSSVCKNFQGIIDTALTSQMVSLGEASAASSYVNPAQNVGATDLIEVEVNIRKKGTARYISATIGFSKS